MDEDKPTEPLLEDDVEEIGHESEQPGKEAEQEVEGRPNGMLAALAKFKENQKEMEEEKEQHVDIEENEESTEETEKEPDIPQEKEQEKQEEKKGNVFSAFAQRIKKSWGGMRMPKDVKENQNSTANLGEEAESNTRQLALRALPPKLPKRRPIDKDRHEPEVHCIGEIVSLQWNDEYETSNAFCIFEWMSGDAWELMAAPRDRGGQTQVDTPYQCSNVIWNHPLDAHFFTRAVQGWPQLTFQVYSLDMYGTPRHRGYAVTHLPTKAGHHSLPVEVWRPLGTNFEELGSFFLGLNPQLRDPKQVFQNPHDQRSKLITKSVGKIQIDIDIILRNFDVHQISWDFASASRRSSTLSASKPDANANTKRPSYSSGLNLPVSSNALRRAITQ